MRKRAILLFFLVALAALMLSACGGVIDNPADPLVLPDQSNNTADTPVDQDTPSDPPPSNGEEQSDTPVAGEESQPDQPDQPDQETQDEQVSALLAKPELGYELGAAQLIASDPNQINLASGQPQLVELFAFW
jgi:hypothetical protein